MTYWPQTNGGTLYVWPGLDALHAYSLNTANSLFTQTHAGTFNFPGQPATALALSANGTNASTGILWAPVMNTTSEANSIGVSGILHAYNASNPAQELWNSAMVGTDGMALAEVCSPGSRRTWRTGRSCRLWSWFGYSVWLKAKPACPRQPLALLTSPANAATPASGSAITLSANAFAAPGNSITSVSFMDGATVLATVTSAPYGYTWTSAAIGIHTVTAMATDQTGGCWFCISCHHHGYWNTCFQFVRFRQASLTMVAGSSASTVITLTPLNGYNGTLSSSLSGLPAGLAASWQPGSSNNTFILTFTASQSVSAGSYSIGIIAGSNGSVQDTLFIPLTISPTALNAGGNTLLFNLPNGATLGAPIVFTEGVPSTSLANPDFTSRPVSYHLHSRSDRPLCSGRQFIPQFPGLRRARSSLLTTTIMCWQPLMFTARRFSFLVDPEFAEDPLLVWLSTRSRRKCRW